MRWTASPTRRELTLAISSLTIFILSYNLDSSLRIVGLDPLASEGAVLNKLGLTRGTSTFDKDGRRPLGWRDRLEDVVFGEWAWDEGEVAGDGGERKQGKGMGRYGAIWAGRDAQEGEGGGRAFGESTADDVLDWWGAEMPVTSLVKHVPGHTILDNVILFNGTVYIVTDTPTAFPSISSIVSKPDREWKILSSSLARSGLGQYGGKIQGVTWISTDVEPHPTTLPSLWRTYTSLDPHITASGETSLPPPRRVIFPYIPTFAEPPLDESESLLSSPSPSLPSSNSDSPDDSEDQTQTQPGARKRRRTRTRRRSNTGLPPHLTKLAFPTLGGHMFKEDWEDYMGMEVPYVLERVVIVDRGAGGGGVFASAVTPLGSTGKVVDSDSAVAKSNSDGTADTESERVTTSTSNMETSPYWWEPIRRNVALHFDAYRTRGDGRKMNAGKGGNGNGMKNAGKVVVYVHNNLDDANDHHGTGTGLKNDGVIQGGNGQGTRQGGKLRKTDHEALLKVLGDMQRDYGYQVHVVSGNDIGVNTGNGNDASGNGKGNGANTGMGWMGDVVKSTIMIGPHSSLTSTLSLFMNPSPQTTVMEFFPSETFTNDGERVVRGVGMRYVAWVGSKMFTHDNLPPNLGGSVGVDGGDEEEISIDALAVSNAIREIFGRK